MMQEMLSDRFKLKVHLGTKQGTVYALQVAKQGPKLLNAGKGAAPTPEEMKIYADGKIPPLDSRGDGRLGYELIAHGCSMKELAESVSGLMHAPVVDKTGLTGTYDFTLQYHEGDKEAPNKWPPVPVALQEQLGLKLQTEKGPVPLLVIDYIEKPSAN